MSTTARVNPFQQYYDICNQQKSKEKRQHLPPMPRYMDVELTNRCNFKCYFCPTGTGQQRRETGFMSEEVFARLLEGASAYKIPLRFIRWGEPTLHRNWLEYLRRAAQAGLTVHLTTNGSLLDEQSIRALLEIPLDSIKFSFQGVDAATYREMRSRDRFEELLGTVELMHRLRGDALLPFMHISTTVTYEGAESIEAFKRRVEPFVDTCHVGRTLLEHIDPDKVRLGEEELAQLKRLQKAETLVKIHPQCHQVFDVLSVNWDGKVSACCRDYDELMIVGHLLEEDLQAIWTGKKLNAYRRILVDMGHDKLPLCRSCYDMNQRRLPGVQKL